MAIDGLHLPVQGLKTEGRVFALRLIRHSIERHVVRIVDQNQVIKALMSGKGDGFQGYALLHAPIAGQGDHVMIENRMLRSIEVRFQHLASYRHTHGVADTLPQRTSGGLNPRRVMKLGMAGGLAVELTERFDVGQRQIVATQVEPRIEKHGAVSGRENKTVAVNPTRAFRIVLECVTIKHCSHLRCTQRKSQVSGLAGMDGVHGQATGLIGSFCEKESLQGHIRRKVKGETAQRSSRKGSDWDTKKRAQEGSL